MVKEYYIIFKVPYKNLRGYFKVRAKNKGEAKRIFLEKNILHEEILEITF